MKLQIGLDAINSYKRMRYSPWHAMAEFIDNSTQSYFDHTAEMDAAFKKEGEGLRVSIAYDREADYLRIVDNAMGMSYEELTKALKVASPPDNPTGRSRYGMGLKTSACWIGNKWTVTTKRLGETKEYRIEVDVPEVAKGKGDLPEQIVEGKAPHLHYTIIEIKNHNQRFQGRTLGKIKDFLSSMYREDFRNGRLTLEWQGVPLAWNGFEGRILKAQDGSLYKKDFAFEIENKPVKGWVGVLERGSRADAGFSILHSGRVVKGWPDAWRPSSLYGQLQGSNDLVNQRLVGEIHLDAFEVTHTKDDIVWLGYDEELVEKALEAACKDYREVAKRFRKGDDDQRGPTQTETDVAVDELRKELTAPEMIDSIRIEDVPEADAAEEVFRNLTESVEGRAETFKAELGDVTVRGYIAFDLSPNDPYVAFDSARDDEVLVIVNIAHPHWKQVKGPDGALNYFRHCTYDAIAEWKARRRAAALTPDTIRLIKDKLLRVSFDIETHEADVADDAVAAPPAVPVAAAKRRPVTK